MLVIWAVLLTVPLWLPLLGGYTALAGRVLVLGLAAMSFNFLLGFTGVMSFGHAAYFGLGAYGAGLTLKYLAASTPLAMLMGTLLGGVAGAIVGLLIARRRGVYFAMATVAFGQIGFYIAYSWNDLTGGYDGLRGFSRAPLHLGFTTIDIANNGTLFYYFLLFVFAIAVAAQGLLLASPFGRTLLAIRENERRARFLGIPVDRHIWLSFTISCFFTALAGSLYALLNNFADPMAMHYSLSGEIVIMAVMGGMRAFWGPLVGAAVFVVLQDYISSMTVNWMSFVGLIFVLVVLFFPRGLLGMLQRRGAAMSAMLEVRDVSKHFGSLRAVQNVSLTVAKGELRAIIGPNGAGKTTFFNMISGFFPPTVGRHRVRRRGRSPNGRLPRASHRGMARTFQITEIFPELTVRENVRIGAESAAGMKLSLWRSKSAAAQVEARIDEMLGPDRACHEGRPAGGRTVAWRPARRRDRHGADAAAAAAAAGRADRRAWASRRRIRSPG